MLGQGPRARSDGMDPRHRSYHRRGRTLWVISRRRWRAKGWFAGLLPVEAPCGIFPGAFLREAGSNN